MRFALNTISVSRNICCRYSVLMCLLLSISINSFADWSIQKCVTSKHCYLVLANDSEINNSIVFFSDLCSGCNEAYPHKSEILLHSIPSDGMIGEQENASLEHCQEIIAGEKTCIQTKWQKIIKVYRTGCKDYALLGYHCCAVAELALNAISDEIYCESDIINEYKKKKKCSCIIL